MISLPVSPSSPASEQPTIGIIGMGSMGQMYANLFAQAGWARIHVCDRPVNHDALLSQFSSSPNVVPLKDGHAVARSSDFIMYSVEAEFIDAIVKEYGPSTKVGCIVSGQTSVKEPEIKAFEKWLPEDVEIVTVHSLHGPSVSPEGQPLVIVQHRASDSSRLLVESILTSFKSRFVHLSYKDHDLVTANTQAVTHAAFLSMGTAWAAMQQYPWEQGLYVGGIETVKVNIMLRIYSNMWHVYAGLAILNPSARIQIDQYAQSATEIFKLMLCGDEVGLRQRMYKARDVVFGSPSRARSDTNGGARRKRPILLSEHVLDRFSLGRIPEDPVSREKQLASLKSNSHLSLLAMVDCWAHLGINPFHHLALAATPLFRLFLGVAEYLFVTSPDSEVASISPMSSLGSTSTDSSSSLFSSPSPRLDHAIHAAAHDTSHRNDDLEFVVAARGWSQCVSFGSFEVYRKRFEETRAFFETRFEEAGKLGQEMIKVIMESSKEDDL
jgi:prephenate dehydrogenase (NADP+)